MYLYKHIFCGMYPRFLGYFLDSTTQCLQITEKVSFNGANEAIRQKFIKNTKKMVHFVVFLKTEPCSQRVLLGKSILK